MLTNTLVLMPGDFYFGQQKLRLKTLLGSCVSIVVWHPQKQLGGMCHFVLPSRHGHVPAKLDARYADEAMQLFLNEMTRHKTKPGDYQAWLFGGANMFSKLAKECRNHDATHLHRCANCNSVACRNRIAAFELINRHGLVLMEADLGGHQHRQIEFQLGRGDPHIKHTHTVATPGKPLIPLWTQRL